MRKANGLNILGRQFQPQVLPSVMCLFFIVLFIVLGFWQIHRYHYKLELLTHYQASMQQAPVSLSSLMTQHEMSFKQVKVEGVYLNKQTAFIQNRYAHDKVGYDVLTPLQLSGEDRLLLINRGWVPFRANLLPPNVAAVTGKLKVIGYIKLLNEYIFTLGKNIVSPTVRPLVMQKVNVTQLEKLTGKRYYPFVLRLNKAEKHGFVRDWQPINVLPARHMGYAIQWFVMALVLAIAYFIFSSTSNNKGAKHAEKSK